MFVLQEKLLAEFDEKLEGFFNRYKFSNHETIILFYCCKKLFIYMNVWIIGKNSMNYHYLKKKTFTVT